MKSSYQRALWVAASQAAEKVIYFVIPSGARNLSSIETQEKKNSSAGSVPRFNLNVHRERNDKILSFSAPSSAATSKHQESLSFSPSRLTEIG
jgi:hypothetical protein